MVYSPDGDIQVDLLVGDLVKTTLDNPQWSDPQSPDFRTNANVLAATQAQDILRRGEKLAEVVAPVNALKLDVRHAVGERQTAPFRLIEVAGNARSFNTLERQLYDPTAAIVANEPVSGSEDTFKGKGRAHSMGPPTGFSNASQLNSHGPLVLRNIRSQESDGHDHPDNLQLRTPLSGKFNTTIPDLGDLKFSGTETDAHFLSTRFGMPQSMFEKEDSGAHEYSRTTDPASAPHSLATRFSLPRSILRNGDAKGPFDLRYDVFLNGDLIESHTIAFSQTREDVIIKIVSGKRMAKDLERPMILTRGNRTAKGMPFTRPETFKAPLVRWLAINKEIQDEAEDMRKLNPDSPLADYLTALAKLDMPRRMKTRSYDSQHYGVVDVVLTIGKLGGPGQESNLLTSASLVRPPWEIGYGVLGPIQQRKNPQVKWNEANSMTPPNVPLPIPIPSRSIFLLPPSPVPSSLPSSEMVRVHQGGVGRLAAPMRPSSDYLPPVLPFGPSPADRAWQRANDAATFNQRVDLQCPVPELSIDSRAGFAEEGIWLSDAGRGSLGRQVHETQRTTFEDKYVLFGARFIIT